MRSMKRSAVCRASSAIVGAELDQQVAAALRHQLEVRRALLAQAVDERAFESFEADRIEFENLGHVIRGRERVAVAEADQRSVLRAVNQPQLRLEHDHAGAFGADQRARHVEAVLGQQLVEVVAGHPPRNARKARADQVGVSIAQVAQRRVDLAAASAASR